MGDNRKLTNISNARLWMQLSLKKRRKETRDIIQRAGQSRELPMMIATAGLQKRFLSRTRHEDPRSQSSERLVVSAPC